MSNQHLDHGADAIGHLREQPHVAGLAAIEQQLAETALERAPELDRRLMGAAWMLLGEGLADLATAAGEGLSAQLLINLTQLAGQRLYTGAGLPREVRCPELYSTGARCRFVAKGVVDELIDAQMRGHYGTYHSGKEWPPAEEPFVTVYANYIGPDGERIPAEVTVTRHGDGMGTCASCGDLVTIHEDGSTTGGVDTLVGILCDRCVVLDAAARSARRDGREAPTLQSVQEGRHSINEYRRAAGLPAFDEPSVDERRVLGPKYPRSLDGALQAIADEAEGQSREAEARRETDRAIVGDGDGADD